MANPWPALTGAGDLHFGPRARGRATGTASPQSADSPHPGSPRPAIGHAAISPPVDPTRPVHDVTWPPYVRSSTRPALQKRPHLALRIPVLYLKSRLILARRERIHIPSSPHMRPNRGDSTTDAKTSGALCGPGTTYESLSRAPAPIHLTELKKSAIWSTSMPSKVDESP